MSSTTVLSLRRPSDHAGADTKTQPVPGSPEDAVPTKNLIVPPGLGISGAKVSFGSIILNPADNDRCSISVTSDRHQQSAEKFMSAVIQCLNYANVTSGTVVAIDVRELGTRHLMEGAGDLISIKRQLDARGATANFENISPELRRKVQQLGLDRVLKLPESSAA